MRTLLGVLCAVLLAWCSRAMVPIVGPVAPASGSAIATHAHQYAVLHSFGKGSDGVWPVAALIDVNGTLY